MATTKRTKKETPAPVLSQKEENVFARITKVITQLSIAIVAIVVVFSPENAWVLGPIIGSLAIMAIALGYFASK